MEPGANKGKTPMQRHRYARPETPMTPGVSGNIETKIRILCRKFRDFDEEKREDRAGEIRSRLAGAVMIAYGKFRENDTCSWESNADRAIRWEIGHIVHDFVARIKRERVTVSGDEPVPGEDDDPVSFTDCRADGRDYLEEAIDRFDMAEALEILERRHPRCASVVRLRLEGYKLSEIMKIGGFQKWELYDVVWPAAIAELKKIYGE